MAEYRLNPKDRITGTARLRFEWPAVDSGNGEAAVVDRLTDRRLGAARYMSYKDASGQRWGLLVRSAANEYVGTPRRGVHRREFLCATTSQAEAWLLKQWGLE